MEGGVSKNLRFAWIFIIFAANLEQLIQSRAWTVVREVEEWAKRQADKPNGEDKLARALKFLQEYDEPFKLTETLRAKSEAFIHAALSEERLPPGE